MTETRDGHFIFWGRARIKIFPPNMRSVDLEIRLNSTKKLYPTGIDIEIVFHYRYEVLSDMFASRIVSTDPTLLLWRTKTIQFHHKLCLINEQRQVAPYNCHLCRLRQTLKRPHDLAAA